MAKFANDDVMDAALNLVKSNATRMVACTGQPATYAEANTTMKLAEVTMASADFTLANGATSGRRITVAAKSAVPITATGTANHVALLDVANSRLLYVTTAPGQALTSGATVAIGAWDIEISDPA
jgi:hypothetical protein